MSDRVVKGLVLARGQEVLALVDPKDYYSVSWMMRYATETGKESNEVKIDMSLYLGFQKNPADPVKLNSLMIFAVYDVSDELKDFYLKAIEQLQTKIAPKPAEVAPA